RSWVVRSSYPCGCTASARLKTHSEESEWAPVGPRSHSTVAVVKGQASRRARCTTATTGAFTRMSTLLLLTRRQVGGTLVLDRLGAAHSRADLFVTFSQTRCTRGDTD